MRFHANTLAILDVDAEVSQSAVSLLNAAEVRIGRAPPASVREWYSLDGAIELLRRYSNDDPPVQIKEFGLLRKETDVTSDDDLLERDLVIFRYENQGVCAWAFRIDGSDDPPVYVDNDWDSGTWTQCMPKFSEHLYAWMWDFSMVLIRGLLVQAQNQPVSDAAISFLRGSFNAAPETHGWPGHTQYRFYSGDKRILIWASDGQADWWLSAETEESLRYLVVQVGECDQVRQSLWSNSDRGEALLHEVNLR